MTEKIIAVARVKEIYYEDPDHDLIDHIGCRKIDHISHKAACGHVNLTPFDPTSIDDTPEQFVCLGCIVATQHCDDNTCWHDGLACICQEPEGIVT
jgi:hypothetical protein